MPLTVLQKRWLKAISLDPRIRLFDFDSSGLEDVPPLFTPDDIYIFDRYADGDPFEDEVYIQIFHRILDAIKKRYPLSIDVKNRREARTHLNVMPEYLEYSEKDDKFRLLIAEKRAQANVITRREEVASTRSLLNTAKLMEENPTLYRLKELEHIERICENVGNINLNGNGDVLSQLIGLMNQGTAS